MDSFIAKRALGVIIPKTQDRENAFSPLNGGESDAQVQSFVQDPPRKSLTKSINILPTQPQCSAAKALPCDVGQIHCTRHAHR